jgi:hypothetical protein
MKNLLFLFLMAAFSHVAIGQVSANKEEGPIITFEKKTHDFGTITQGDKVQEVFKFKNTGNQPLIITNVQVTCGCTTPKGWPRDPIMPGGEGELTIAFDSAGKMGRQDKTVTVISNAVNADGGKLSFSTQIVAKANY